MTQTVKLPRDTRIFINPCGNQLANEYHVLPAGTELELTERKIMIYDHRLQHAAAYKCPNGKRWILVNEAGLQLEDEQQNSPEGAPR